MQQAQPASSRPPPTTGTVESHLGGAHHRCGWQSLLGVGGTTYTIAIAASETAERHRIRHQQHQPGSAARRRHRHRQRRGDLVLTANVRRTSFTDRRQRHLDGGFGLTTGATSPAPAPRAPRCRSNYNALLTQIDQLAGDSAYNGVNLLGGNNLQINFNETATSSLTIAGVNFNSAGLGLSSISGSGTGSFQDNSALSSTVTNINTAISNVQTQTETFGTNSSTISTRQTFTTNMINTLQTGASNLVAADQNQESANLLTEQTQQQLEISALSIANQANQSVLKLFG